MKPSSSAQPVAVHRPSPAVVNRNQSQGRSGDIAQSIRGSSNKPASESLVLQRLATACKGHLTRQAVCVKAIGDGKIHTRISKVGHLPSTPGAPVDTIRSRMQKGAVYDSIKITNGASHLDVAAVPDGQQAQPLETILNRVDDNQGQQAYVTGGFFVIRNRMLSDNGTKPAKGYAVGQTKGKRDVTPVPRKWREDYGAVRNANGEVLIEAGPKLEKNKDFSDTRFLYSLGDDGRDNPDNDYAGALTHAGDYNQRSAISFDVPNAEHEATAAERKQTLDVRLHTLTTRKNKRELGVTMSQWNDIVNARREDGMQHINLDGSASVRMGIRDNGKLAPVSSGSPPGKERPLVTALWTRADRPGEASERPITRQPAPSGRDVSVRTAAHTNQLRLEETLPAELSRLCCFPAPRMA